MNSQDFLFPKNLEVTPSNMSKIMLVGSCHASSFVYHMGLLNRNINVDHVLFNNFADLSDVTPLKIEEYDIQIVALPLRDIVSDMIIDFQSFNDADKNSLIRERAFSTLRTMLSSATKYTREHGILTAVMSFMVPLVPVTSSLKSTYSDTDFRNLVIDLNRELAAEVEMIDNAYIVDVEAIASAIGKRYISEEIFGFYSHGTFFWGEYSKHDSSPGYNAPPGGRIEFIPPIDEHYDADSDEFVLTVIRSVEAIYRTANQVDTVKMVVFDLDDTLWRGQIAEHYGDEASWPVAHGWPLGVWEAIQHLRARGIIVAICSKNEEQLVRARWSRAISEPWLTLDDFVFVHINWNPKAENIRQMADVAGLTMKSILFVDDNPVERESVMAALPGIRTIGTNPYDTKRILLWSPETQRGRITGESARRESMMRKQVERESVRSSLSREEFLASLECKVSISVIESLDSDRIDRTLELLNRTNQFNTTGRRWKRNEIGSFFAGGGKVYTFEVEDRFTAYGLVGIVLYQNQDFVQFAMSCRVLGLGVEGAVLAMIINNAEPNHGSLFTGAVIETDSNFVCRDVYTKVGFWPGQEAGAFHLAFVERLPVPPHLEFQFD